ncbi:response regulator transcription factor [Streptomyces sp. JJ36]|uniref:response regulator transcription factor n=1 Tax=Streptomyces sp. JJ36 TaxID=2736645 RepID=UPI001F01C5F3|nr:response regulator transcription factor [Streptomyces sp. JJ36]MCF6522248.1 DNA-binding response regulator [Streptomyces sp. JJ36]
MQRRIRVLVVDDHRIFAESLAAALAAEQDVEVTAAGNGAAAVRCTSRAAAEGRGFDVLLVDADLDRPPGDGSAAPGPGSGAGAAGASGPGATARAGGPPGPNGTRPATTPVSAASPVVAAPPVATATTAVSGAPPGKGPEPGAAPARRSAGAGTSAGAAVPPVRAEEPAGGLALVARVRTEHPAMRTVVLAERDDPARAAAALQAGACGWVAKDSSLSRLLQVIRGVLRGETHLPPALLTGVLRELTADREHRSESERLVASLTPREHEVLRCMVAGLGRKAVAERLYLSPHTVRTHMQNVLGKLGVHSTLAAVALARRAGVGPA